MLYPRTLNITIYRGSCYDLIIRFKSDTALVDISDYGFIAYFFNSAREEVLRADIIRKDDNTIELYIPDEQTPLFQENGTWKLEVTIPGIDRTYFIIKGKVTVRF